MKKNSKLLALTASAMTLPGVALQSQATSAPVDSEVGYRFSGYFESDIPEERIITGTNKRYDILVNQFHLLHPINDHAIVTYEGTFETLSGASQYMSTYQDNNSNGTFDEGVDSVGIHMSGASIEEKRVDSYVGARFYKSKTDESPSAGNYGGRVGFSKENDYLSLSGSVDGAMEFDDAHTTVSAGASFSYDTLSPTPASDTTPADEDVNSPGRMWASIYDNRNTISVFLGLGQIVNPNLVVQANSSFTIKQGSGVLTDPYREFNGLAVDSRPETRAMVTFSTGMRYAIAPVDGVIHADYRFYWDDWGIASNTLALAWHQRFTVDSDAEEGLWAHLSDNDVAFVISPTLRYYQQSSANFYGIISESNFETLIGSGVRNPSDPGTTFKFLGQDADGNQQYLSSDPRLAAYGALSGGMGLRVEYQDFAFVSNFEMYTSSSALGFSQQELPNAIDYFRFSVGLDYIF